jgi:stearoyl-CoA desaturase (delta-9 desaturase)
VALGLAIPAAIGGLVTMSWTGALLGFLWGGAVRVFMVHHITWSINSACHLWGTRPFESKDDSRNNAFFGVIGLGEGWHNNHHAFPGSARHGLRWWEVDTSYWVIRAMELVGLARNVRTVEPERMAARARHH